MPASERGQSNETAIQQNRREITRCVIWRTADGRENIVATVTFSAMALQRLGAHRRLASGAAPD
jgi:hypothetical protein